MIETDELLEVKIKEITRKVTYSPVGAGGYVTRDLVYEIYKCSYLPKDYFKYKLKPGQYLGPEK